MPNQHCFDLSENLLLELGIHKRHIFKTLKQCCDIMCTYQVQRGSTHTPPVNREQCIHTLKALAPSRSDSSPRHMYTHRRMSALLLSDGSSCGQEQEKGSRLTPMREFKMGGAPKAHLGGEVKPAQKRREQVACSKRACCGRREKHIYIKYVGNVQCISSSKTPNLHHHTLHFVVQAWAAVQLKQERNSLVLHVTVKPHEESTKMGKPGRIDRQATSTLFSQIPALKAARKYGQEESYRDIL